MFGISETLVRELSLQTVSKQCIVIPRPIRGREYTEITTWLFENVGKMNSHSFIETGQIDGEWYIMNNIGKMKIWIKDPNARTLTKLTWG